MKQLCLIAALFLYSLIQAQDTARAEASTREATVYFGYGAELTHQSAVKVTAGTRIIVIGRLSSSIDIASLQISCPESVTLLSHRYSIFQPPVPIAVRSEEMKKIDDSIQVIGDEIRRIENKILIAQEVLTKTGALIEATTANGNKTITSAEVLKLVEYYSAKIERAKTDIYNHRETIARQRARIEEWQIKAASLPVMATTAPAAYGQLTLQVVCKQAGEIPISLSYYTARAGWTPVYDIRVNSKTNRVKLVYKASLTQTSGIDWKKTKLTLSTGTPNFGVAAPILSPWYLQLYVPELYNALQGSVSGLNIRGLNSIQSMSDDKKLSEVVITGYGQQYKQREEADTAIDPATLQEYTTLNEGQLNTNFEIDLPYDVGSDGEMHSVTIRDEEIDCVLKNYAVPRMDREAYLLAEVANWQELDLLPGEANIIMDETYVGKSMIDPNTTADTLNLSLGRDKRLAVKRTLVKELSSLRTSGGNNKQTFTYEIVVKNNKQTEVNLLLKDQYPVSTIKEVEVKLEDSGEAIVNEEKGILSWKVGLKPGESRKFRVSYSVRYPKDKKIVNLK